MKTETSIDMTITSCRRKATIDATSNYGAFCRQCEQYVSISCHVYLFLVFVCKGTLLFRKKRKAKIYARSEVICISTLYDNKGIPSANKRTRNANI